VSQASTLLQLGLVHLALTAAPGVAAILLTARFGRRDTPTLLGVGLAASGLSAMAVLWAFYADPTVGKVAAYAVVAASAVVAVTAVRTLGDRVRELGDLLPPLVLWGLGVLFLLFFGFLHGGTGEPLRLASVRFSHQLPSDSFLPLSFADWLYVHGHHGAAPHVGDWLASDRPPLQTAYVLAQRPFAWDTSGLHYQVLGVALQLLWIPGLWAVLSAARVRRPTRSLAMVAVLLSDVAIVHGFYVWPKLLAAAFLLGAAALVLSDGWRDARRRPPLVLLAACLMGLALLAHGSSVFGIVPIVAVAVFRGVPNLRLIGTGLAIGALLWVPWAAYQHWVDPPGNRLAKWMLAGSVPIDTRGTLPTIVDSYESAGVVRVLENKGANFRTMTGDVSTLDHLGDAVSSTASGDAHHAIRELRDDRFSSLLWSTGLFVAAPFVMLYAFVRRRRRDPADWGFALVALAMVALGCVVWGLVLFGNPPARTYIHQGTLLLPLLAVAGLVAGLRAVAPRAAAVFVAVNAASVVALYAPSLDELPGTRFSYAGALAASVCLAGCLAVAALSARPRRGVGDPGPGAERTVVEPAMATSGATE